MSTLRNPPEPQLRPADSRGTTKSGRKLYVRLFPNQIAFLLAHLTPAEFRAYIQLLCEFVLHEGNLPDDDRALARASGLKPKPWEKLRPKLIGLRLGDSVAGRWIDWDQLQNVQRYLANSEKQRQRVNVRWANRSRLSLVESPKEASGE